MTHGKAPAAALIGRPRSDRRAQGRIPAEIDVVVKDGRGRLTYRTLNVTRCGLFIRTDDPKSPREMIDIEVDLGEPLGRLEVVCVVRHATDIEESAINGRPPGMGVQLYGVSARDQRRWEAFVRRLAEGEAEAKAGDTPRMTIAPDDPTPKAILSVEFDADASEMGTARIEGGAVMASGSNGKGRAFQKTESNVFRLEMKSGEQIKTFLERDYQAGGVFMITKRQPPEGSPVIVRVVHHDSGAVLDLGAKVIWRGQLDGPQTGLRVQFVNRSEQARQAFEEFVTTGLPPLDLDLEITAN